MFDKMSFSDKVEKSGQNGDVFKEGLIRPCGMEWKRVIDLLFHPKSYHEFHDRIDLMV